MKALAAHHPAAAVAVPSPARWLTHAAFVIAFAVVIARLTSPDALRDPWDTTPGSAAVPATPGPGIALVFDLIAGVPALLVLIRRAIDNRFQLTPHMSHLPMFALVIWAVLSTFWSADRFAAAVVSAHFLSAACLLWALSQLVRSAQRLRLVAAIAFGLLLVLVVQTMFYRFMDVPENIRYWQEHKTEILTERSWPPDSFAARQFELKLTSGEIVGFFNSANTLAAVGVLLFFTSAGIGFQKWRDGESRNWLVLPAMAAAALVWVLICARSKTSAITPFLGVGILSIFLLLQRRLQSKEFEPRRRGDAEKIKRCTGVYRKYHKFCFFISLTLIAFSIIALIGHGLYHHGLFPGHFSNSLDFRWKYWTASAGIFTAHPLIGVGWGNFGYHYLAHRLPEAVEEIKDPHNFLVRMFVELGSIGGLLCIAWLVRLAWEITQRDPETTETTSSVRVPPNDDPITMRSIATIAVLGLGMHIISNVDFSYSTGDVIAFLIKPILYLLALISGSVIAAMLSQQSSSLDDRPAPWIYCSLVTGLGLFLIHNLIDFGWFEAGGMTLFMALIGSAQGMTSAVGRPKMSRPLATAGAIAAVSGWLLVAGFFVVPVMIAEQSAAEANESLRTATGSDAGAHYTQAIAALDRAVQAVPYNSDYLFREAEARISLGQTGQAIALLARARQVNPMQLDGYLLDANLRLSQAMPDVPAIQAVFTKVLQLNPNDVSLHIQYAQALDRLGLPKQAAEQYRLALSANDALPALEPRRLTPEQVRQLKAKV